MMKKVVVEQRRCKQRCRNRIEKTQSQAMEIHSMQEAFEAFLEQPNQTRYLAARRLLSHPRRENLDLELSRVSQACLEGRFSAAEHLLDAIFLPLCLSPRAHFFAGWIAKQKADEQGAELANFCFHACLEGIQSTGAGTRPAPFRVTYRSDVADIVKALGQTSQRIQTTLLAQITYDVVTCDDGAALWFDVSLVVGADPAEPAIEPLQKQRARRRQPGNAAAAAEK